MTSRKLLGLALRVLITTLVLGYLFWRADLAQVGAALKRIPVTSTLAALAALSASIATGILRWRALLAAYGATPAPWRDLARWYLLAGFYNLLPGGIGGDVLRGYQTRTLFTERGAVRALSVVFVERVLGFAGLLVLAGMASLAQPAVRDEILLYACLGLAVAIAAVLAVAQGRKLSRSLPTRTRRYFVARARVAAAHRPNDTPPTRSGRRTTYLTEV